MRDDRDMCLIILMKVTCVMKSFEKAVRYHKQTRSWRPVSPSSRRPMDDYRKVSIATCAHNVHRD